MSYARLGPKSDVYVYSDGLSYVCEGCLFWKIENVPRAKWLTICFETRYEMLLHLAFHLDAGHRVPPGALLDLLRDLQYSEIETGKERMVKTVHKSLGPAPAASAPKKKAT